MIFKIVIKPLVISDAEEAVDYYNQKSEDLGQRFYKHFLASLIDIQSNPLSSSYIRTSETI